MKCKIHSMNRSNSTESTDFCTLLVRNEGRKKSIFKLYWTSQQMLRKDRCAHSESELHALIHINTYDRNSNIYCSINDDENRHAMDAHAQRKFICLLAHSVITCKRSSVALCNQLALSSPSFIRVRFSLSVLSASLLNEMASTTTQQNLDDNCRPFVLILMRCSSSINWNKSSRIFQRNERKMPRHKLICVRCTLHGVIWIKLCNGLHLCA